MNKLKQKFYDKKSPSVFPEEVKHAINLLSIPHSHVSIVGTSSSKLTPYFGDIDIYNKVDFKATRKEAVKTFELFIKSRIPLIQMTNDLYFSDFKCGEHEGNGIHWTQQEILNGTTRHTSLEQAIGQHNHVIKIDVLIIYGNRIIELTVFYDLYYHGENLNGDGFSIKTVEESLKKDIDHYTGEEPNHFKAIKRYYSLLRITGKANDKDIKFISDILSSNAGLVSQNIAILEGLELVLDNPQKFSVDLQDLINIVENIQFNLQSTGEVLINESVVSQLSNIKQLLLSSSQQNNKAVAVMIKNIVASLKKSLNLYTIDKLKQNNINLKGGSLRTLLRERALRQLKREAVVEAEIKQREKTAENKKEAVKKEKELLAKTAIDDITDPDTTVVKSIDKVWAEEINELFTRYIREERRQYNARTGQNVQMGNFKPSITIDGMPISSLSQPYDLQNKSRGLLGLLTRKLGKENLKVSPADLMKLAKNTLDRVKSQLATQRVERGARRGWKPINISLSR